MLPLIPSIQQRPGLGAPGGFHGAPPPRSSAKAVAFQDLHRHEANGSWSQAARTASMRGRFLRARKRLWWGGRRPSGGGSPGVGPPHRRGSLPARKEVREEEKRISGCFQVPAPILPGTSSPPKSLTCRVGRTRPVCRAPGSATDSSPDSPAPLLGLWSTASSPQTTSGLGVSWGLGPEALSGSFRNLEPRDLRRNHGT